MPQCRRNQDDTALLKRIARGDADAMRWLYERYHDRLVSFLILRGCDEAMAEDVVQDTMLDLWHQADRFGGRCDARTWVYRIARNKMIDRMRRGAHLSLVEEVPAQMDPGPDPATVIANAEEASAVRAGLRKLSRNHAAVLRLAFFEHLTCEEIALVEAIPVGTVKTRIYHGKRALLHHLGGLFGRSGTGDTGSARRRSGI